MPLHCSDDVVWGERLIERQVQITIFHINNAELAFLQGGDCRQSPHLA